MYLRLLNKLIGIGMNPVQHYSFSLFKSSLNLNQYKVPGISIACTHAMEYILKNTALISTVTE